MLLPCYQGVKIQPQKNTQKKRGIKKLINQALIIVLFS
jgi:hypothetical protein